MKRLHIFLFSLFMMSVGVSAQTVLTLDQCRTMALEYNKTLKIADSQAREAVANQKQARTAYLPMIDGVGTAMYLPQLDNIEVPGFHLPTADANGNITGESDVYFPGMNLETERLRIFQAQLSMTVPLYAGGQVRNANKMADLGVDITQKAYRLKEDEVVLTTDQIYWQLMALNENVQVAETYVLMLDSLESQLKAMYEVGLTPKSEYLKVSVQKNQAQLNLLKAQNGVQLMRMRLCQVIGMDMNAPVVIEGSLDENPALVAMQGAVSQALSQRAELGILTNQVAIANYQQKNVSGSYMPQLGAQINYGYNEIPNLVSGGYQTTASAQLSIPLVHWREKKHKMDAARLVVQQRELQLSDTRDLVQLEVNQHMLQVSEAWQAIALARKGRDEAEETLSEVKLSFETGLNTTTDLLNAQANWQNAQARMLESLAQYEIAKARYNKSIGQER